MFAKKKKKKREDQNKISKNEGFFFEQHPLSEKSPTTTAANVIHLLKIYFF